MQRSLDTFFRVTSTGSNKVNDVIIIDDDNQEEEASEVDQHEESEDDVDVVSRAR